MSEHEPNPHPPGPTVRELVEVYKKLAIGELSQSARYNAERELAWFVADFGDRPVSGLKAVELSLWIKNHPGWKAAWTIRRVLSTIKRVFNFGVEQEIIDRNPFARVRHKGRINRRQPMRDEHFQALLRVARPDFRRFLTFLKFTGCRPKEACDMRWRDVFFDQQAVVLKNHKTAAKTGKPRVIPLVPTVVKLLVWMRQHRQDSTVGLVERFFLAAGGRLTPGELSRLVRPYGVSHRGVARARAALGVKKERVGGVGPQGYWRYVLPEEHVPLPEPQGADFVFVTTSGTNFNHGNLAHKVRGLRERAGLPRNVTLYQLRHRYGYMGIKNKVNLKLLSLAMGHTQTTQTEHYISAEALTEDVKLAALQVAFGPGAVAAIAPPPPPRPVVILQPPQVQEIQALSEQLPDRHGNTRPRPQVPIPPPAGAPPAEPIPVDAKKLDRTLDLLLNKLGAPEPGRAGKPAPVRRVMKAAEERAWQNYQWALGRNPELAGAKDRAVFDWLAARPDCPAKLPATFVAFARYLSCARLFHDQRKRVLRRREPLPEPPAAEEEGGAQ